MDRTPPPDARRRVSIGSVEPMAGTSPITFDVQLDVPWITPDSTASFTIATANASDETRQVGPAFFKGASSRFGEPGIVVYNARSRDFDVDDYVPPCFSGRDHDPYVRTRDTDDGAEVTFTREGLGPEPIPAGGSRTERFVVADDPTVAGCVPPNRYRFERVHRLGSGDVRLAWELEVSRCPSGR